MIASKELQKLKFPLGANTWHGHNSETLWVEKISERRYRIRNTPFYAKGISVLDVVSATDASGELVYESTSIASGHSTYRVMPFDSKNMELFKQYWAPLHDLGCTYEGAMPVDNLIAIDVPPSADISKVYGLLQAGEDARVWEFEEGHCAKTV